MPDDKTPPRSMESTIKEIIRIAVISAVLGVLTWLQQQGVIARIDESETSVKQRVKASENLVQETVEKAADEVEEGVAEEAVEVAKELAEEVKATVPTQPDLRAVEERLQSIENRLNERAGTANP